MKDILLDVHSSKNKVVTDGEVILNLLTSDNSKIKSRTVNIESVKYFLIEFKDEFDLTKAIVLPISKGSLDSKSFRSLEFSFLNKFEVLQPVIGMQK